VCTVHRSPRVVCVYTLAQYYIVFSAMKMPKAFPVIITTYLINDQFFI
jgi:hypothetical protein